MGEGVAQVDEEFQHHLAVASDRLATGDAEGAREPLRRASARLPEDGTSLGLLGQACYRAGLFDEAAAAYGRLVNENPAEVSALDAPLSAKVVQGRNVFFHGFWNK
jgi:Flp pilus assembly protein TadD